MEEPKYRNEGSGLVTCAQWETALVSWGAANASVSMLRGCRSNPGAVALVYTGAAYMRAVSMQWYQVRGF